MYIILLANSDILYILSFDKILFTVNVSIVNETPGIFGGGSNNSSVYFIGSQLSLTCLITSTPVTNSEFRWRCSTGCLNGVEIGQTINVTVEQGGMITCAYTVDSIEYSSDPIEIRVPVTGKLYLRMVIYIHDHCT